MPANFGAEGLVRYGLLDGAPAGFVARGGIDAGFVCPRKRVRAFHCQRRERAILMQRGGVAQRDPPCAVLLFQQAQRFHAAVFQRGGRRVAALRGYGFAKAWIRLPEAGYDFIVVMTKSDKLNKTERTKRMEDIHTELAEFGDVKIIPFSASNGEGADEIRKAIEAAAEK